MLFHIIDPLIANDEPAVSIENPHNANTVRRQQGLPSQSRGLRLIVMRKCNTSYPGAGEWAAGQFTARRCRLVITANHVGSL